jgi:CPA2 family monovalent cation:H+ antiporter-2
LYRQLEVSYNWFERNFAATFENAEKTARKKKDLLRMLAPWDAHLVRFKVHPDSPVSGQRLIDSGLRKQYGINVVAIQRGSRTVVAPKPDFQLFPDDEVLVLANDEQVDKGRYAFDRPAEGSAQGAGAVSSIEGYELKGVRLGAGSPLLGKTIRTSELREKFGSTVVGVERGSRRIVNPRSDMTFQMDDVLWLVGETNQIERIGDSSGLRAD